MRRATPKAMPRHKPLGSVGGQSKNATPRVLSQTKVRLEADSLAVDTKDPCSVKSTWDGRGKCRNHPLSIVVESVRDSTAASTSRVSQPSTHISSMLNIFALRISPFLKFPTVLSKLEKPKHNAVKEGVLFMTLYV